MLKRKVLLIFILLLICSSVWAQEFGFGFNDDNNSESSSRLPLSVGISGETKAAIIGYIEDMSEGAEYIDTREMFMFSGKLNFLAKTSLAEGVINLKFVPAMIPVSIDEAYISAFFGRFDFSAGLKKITWGKADQMGPLDILNFLDTSQIFIEMADNNNLNGVKIANPIVHFSYRFGDFSKIEAAFLPSFEVVGAAIQTGVTPMAENNPLVLLIGTNAARWIPEQMRTLSETGTVVMPNYSMLDYAQTGLRFTTTLGSADIGAQYFYGRMFQPAVKMSLLPPDLTGVITDLNDSNFDPNKMQPTPQAEFIFNKYHQIGLDYAQVLLGFNIRAELAANITEDLSGDDGYVYNPSIAWSFGFDRDLFLGINLNMQVNESIRLFNDKIGNSTNPFTPDENQMPSANPNYDIEADTPETNTRITAMLSRKFMRDELELRTAVVWGIEGRVVNDKWNGGDAAIIPAIIWTKDDFCAAFSGCFFVGDEKGQLGQYWKNNFVKLSVKYTF